MVSARVSGYVRARTTTMSLPVLVIFATGFSLPNGARVCSGARGHCHGLHMSAGQPRLGLAPALLKSAAATAAGGVCGSIAHDALLRTASPAHVFIDVLLNLADVGTGLAVGGTLGLLWLIESALLKSGVITTTLQTAASGLKDGDEAAGARIAESVRALRGLEGWLVRTSFELSGVSVEKAFERAMVKEQETKTSGPTVSELLGIVLEETLSARMLDLRLLLAGLTIFGLSGVTGLLFVLDGVLTRFGV